MAAALGALPALMTGLSAAASVAGGISAYQQGKAQEKQMELQAQTEELAMRQDAIAVNEELLITLSHNRVAAAASGLTGEGSVARAQEAAKRRAAQELSTAQFNSRGRQDAITSGARAAGGRAELSLVTSLFDVADTGYKTYKTTRSTK